MGGRSSDYEAKRAALAERIFRLVIRDGTSSLHAMAQHAGVSRPTLRHYFVDRDGAVRAALETAATYGAPHQRYLAALPVDNPRECLLTALRDLCSGWQDHGVGNVHLVGLKAGLEDATTGETYLTVILEPLLRAVETLLTRLVQAGGVAAHDVRSGALALISPIVLALLHQDALGGAQQRPLDLAAFREHLVDAFLRAHPTT